MKTESCNVNNIFPLLIQGTISQMFMTAKLSIGLVMMILLPQR